MLRWGSLLYLCVILLCFYSMFLLCMNKLVGACERVVTQGLGPEL